MSGCGAEGLTSIRREGKEDRDRQTQEHTYCGGRKGGEDSEGVREGARDMQGGKLGIITSTRTFR